MPLKWDSDTQARVAKQLGFDAEDPLIKMEMSQILSKGDQTRKTRDVDSPPPSDSNLDDFLANYEDPTSREAEVTHKSSSWFTSSLSLIVLAGLLLGVLGAGTIILMRARSRNA